jgi:hypothetical protein
MVSFHSSGLASPKTGFTCHVCLLLSFLLHWYAVTPNRILGSVLHCPICMHYGGVPVSRLVYQRLWVLSHCNSISDFFLVSLGGVRLGPLGTSATVGLLYQPRMIDDDYGAVGGMSIGRGNRRTRRKPAPVPLHFVHHKSHMTWDRTRAAAVGSQRLTAWAMARSGRCC